MEGKEILGLFDDDLCYVWVDDHCVEEGFFLFAQTTTFLYKNFPNQKHLPAKVKGINFHFY